MKPYGLFSLCSLEEGMVKETPDLQVTGCLSLMLLNFTQVGVAVLNSRVSHS